MGIQDLGVGIGRVLGRFNSTRNFPKESADPSGSIDGPGELFLEAEILLARVFTGIPCRLSPKRPVNLL